MFLDMRVYYHVGSSIFCSNLAHFPAQAPQKTKKNPLRKKFLMFLEMELSSSNTEKILIFSQKESFSYIFSKESFSYIFSKKSFYISGNGDLDFSAQARNIKKPTWRKFLILQGNKSPEKTSYIFSKESCSYIFGNGNLKKLFYFRKLKS